MQSTRLQERLAQLLPPKFRAYIAAHTKSHRRFVGLPDSFDASGASQFNLLTLLGLREHHYVLDVGCGSLRAGRLLIVYLQPGRYFGIEPEKWLIQSAIRNEIGEALLRSRRPVFDHNSGFRLSVFGRSFDFLLASSIFSHAAASQIATCLHEARLVMTRDSTFVASFVEGAESYAGREWVYPGTVTYTLAHMQDLAAAQGLQCESIGWPYTYGDNTQVWLAFTLPDTPAIGPANDGASVP